MYIHFSHISFISPLQQPKTHEEISNSVRVAIENGSIAKKFNVDMQDIEPCYDPIVQSGKKQELKLSLIPDDKRLRGNSTILCSLGVRFKFMCSNIGRTLFVEPDKVVCS